MKFSWKDIYLFKWGELYYEDLGTYVGLDALKTISNNMEESIQAKKREFHELIAKEMTDIDEEYKASYYQHHFWLEELILDDIEIKQGYSNVISVFSFFEERLRSISALIEKEFDFRIKISDLGSNDIIHKYWIYLKKVYGMDTNKLEPHFTPIKQQKLVRNIITHHGGYANKTESMKIVEAPGLQVDNSRLIFTGNDYPIYLSDCMSSFFKEVYRAVDSRYRILKGDQ